MNLELNDMKAEALARELSHLIENDRYPLSPRIVALKEILGMLRPEPARPAPLPPRRHTCRRATGGIVGEVRLYRRTLRRISARQNAVRASQRFRVKGLASAWPSSF